MIAATNPHPAGSMHAELTMEVHRHLDVCGRCRLVDFTRDVTPCCREGARLHREYRELRRLEREGAA